MKVNYFKEKMLRLARCTMNIKEYSDYGREAQASMAIDMLYKEAEEILIKHEDGYAKKNKEE